MSAGFNYWNGLSWAQIGGNYLETHAGVGDFSYTALGLPVVFSIDAASSGSVETLGGGGEDGLGTVVPRPWSGRAAHPPVLSACHTPRGPGHMRFALRITDRPPNSFGGRLFSFSNRQSPTVTLRPVRAPCGGPWGP